jgi:glycosyltransferase involved in cell wall biosynthesis
MSQLKTSIDEVETLEGQPAISIIIPAYNIGPFINETLDSVFSQTFSDFEVVLINDGSPDTEEFERKLEPYRDKIIYIKQENRGAAAARNCGLRLARGSYVAFLDGDDLWAPTYLEEQLKFIEAGNYDLVYADALIVGDSPLAGRTFMETAPSHGEVTTRSLLLGKCNVITSGVVARRQLIIDVGLFDETLRNSHDFELWVRLAKLGARLAYQRKVLLTYRCHEGSLSGDSINKVVRQLRVYERMQQSYNLTLDERADIRRMVENLNAELELETGKLHLLEGRFDEALSAIKKANIHWRSWKLRATILLLQLCPGLVLHLYRRRTRAKTIRR